MRMRANKRNYLRSEHAVKIPINTLAFWFKDSLIPGRMLILHSLASIHIVSIHEDVRIFIGNVIYIFYYSISYVLQDKFRITSAFDFRSLRFDQRDGSDNIPKKIEPKQHALRRQNIQNLKLSNDSNSISNYLMHFLQSYRPLWLFLAWSDKPPKDSDNDLDYYKQVKKSSGQFVSPHWITRWRDAVQEAGKWRNYRYSSRKNCSNHMCRKGIRLVWVQGCKDWGINENTPGKGH